MNAPAERARRARSTCRALLATLALAAGGVARAYEPASVPEPPPSWLRHPEKRPHDIPDWVAEPDERPRPSILREDLARGEADAAQAERSLLH